MNDLPNECVKMIGRTGIRIDIKITNLTTSYKGKEVVESHNRSRSERI